MNVTDFCPVDHGRLAFRAVGEGIPIVLLHGFSFDMRAWDDQVGVLGGRHRVIRYDLRGFGQSTLPSHEYDHGEDLRTLLEELGEERPILVGLSLGANIALAYALEHPDAVRALVLASPGLPGATWTEERPPDAALAYARTHSVDETKQFWLNHPIFESTRRNAYAFDRVRLMVGDYSGWHWHHANPARAVAVAERLGTCRVPTAVLSGDLDLQGYRTVARRLAAEIPHATIECLPGAGHVLNDEAPERFTSTVLNLAMKFAARP